MTVRHPARAGFEPSRRATVVPGVEVRGNDARRLVAAALLLGALVAGGLTVWAALRPDPPPPTGNRYVVGPEVAGKREFLYQIAADTLGDGNRYREIFELNRGRRQADGARMTTPLDLRPGWVLAMPPDATGPKVSVGPLPAVGESTGGGAVPIGGTATVALLGAMAVTLRGLRRDPSGAVPEEDVAEAGEVPEDDVAGSEAVPEEVVAGSEEVPEPVREPELPAAMEVPAHGIAPVVLDTDAGPVTVALDGAAPGSGPPYGWTAAGDVPEGMRLPVRLGAAGGRTLWTDLAAVPGLLTVGGDTAQAFTRLIVAQVEASGRRVIDHDGALADPPAGCGLVVSGGLRPSEVARAGDLRTPDGERVPVLVVGAVVNARWSVRAGF